MTKEINKVRNELGGIKLELMHWLFVCALGDISADPLTCPKDIAESLDLLSISRTEGNVLPSYVYMSIRDQQPKRVRLLGGADVFEKVLGEWPSPPSGRTERDSVPLQERPHPLSGRIETRRKRWPTNAIIDVGLNDFVSGCGERQASEEFMARAMMRVARRISGYIPGAIGKITELHARYYHQHWNFGVFFESKVASGLSDFLSRSESSRDGFWIAAADDGNIIGSLPLTGAEQSRTAQN